jgi:small GTP-binding protein
MAGTPEREFSIGVLGPGGCRKSELVLRFTQRTFDADYIPSIQDYFEKTMVVDGVSYRLKLIDTAGRDEMQGLTDIGIKDGDGHVIVYSVTSESSFNDVDKYWEKVKNLAVNRPHVVLCGNECESSDRSVTEKAGRDKAAAWGCPFFETSVRDNINVYEVFEAVLQSLLSKPGAKADQSGESKSGGCCNVA